MTNKLGIIGIGVMGGILVDVLSASSLFKKENIFVYDIDKNKIKNKRIKNINIAKNNIELVKKVDIIILCIKPKEIEMVLDEIKNYINSEKILISIVAGITTKFIEYKIEKNIPIIRVMPNTPAQVKQGISAISCGSFAKDTDIEIAKKIFELVGDVIIIDEKYIDAVTALSGSGPAYIAVIIEALSDGGVKVGLPRNISQLLAVQTTLGTAKMIKEKNIHPAELKDKVSSPGGTTISGLSEIEDGKLRSTLIKAVTSAYKRAKELSENK